MAAVSAWSKPGAWALEAEANDAAEKEKGYSSSDSAATATATAVAVAVAVANKPSDEFPSLAAAAKTKTKKKKAQPLSLAEFSKVGQHPVSRSIASRSLTTGEILALPTGPRERTAEELERPRGFGYSSYGRGGRGDDSNPRSGGFDRDSDERRGGGGGFDRDSAPSRADEIDDWGAMKRSSGPPMSERRDRGGFFGGDSQSKADESDSWVSNKSGPPPSAGRRINGGGFDAPRERRGGFEMFNREGSNNSGMDSDTWGRRREENSTAVDSDSWGRRREEVGGGGGGAGRPRIVLQPRTKPLPEVNIVSSDSEELNREELNREKLPVPAVKSKSSNPFGAARPREEVLKEKGEDWKKIDEKLESTKIREAQPEGPFGRRGSVGGASDDHVDRAWRKPATEERAPAWKKPDAVEERAWKKPDAVEERAWKKPEATEERAWKKPGTTEAPPPRVEEVVESHDD